jgi:trehalose 6-phosphate phosphatase
MTKSTYSPAPFEPNYALFLDLDGTLAEFHEEPAQVTLSRPVLDLLRVLYDQLEGAIALVSGRSIEDLTRMLEGQPLCCLGLHGLTQNDHCPEAVGALKAAGDSAASFDTTEMNELRQASIDFAHCHPGVTVEDKQFALALHYRRSPHWQAAVRQFAHEYLQSRNGRSGFALLEGKMVVEFRPAGINKGVAIARLLKHRPFAGRVPVFIGDDVTDEAGFEAVNAAQGVSIKCGDGRSCAQFRLPDIAAVHRWLEGYSATLSETRGS